MAEDTNESLGSGELEATEATEVGVGVSEGGRRIPLRRLVMGLSTMAVVAAVVIVAVSLEEPGSKVVVVRSGGSDPDPSISVGFTSTLPETTVESTDVLATSVGTDTTTVGVGTSGPGGTDVQDPGVTIPPPGTLPPGTTTQPTVPPTLPPDTVDPSTTTTTMCCAYTTSTVAP